MADDETAAAATRPDVARETSVAAEGAGVHCSAALTSSASGPGKPDGEATTRPVPSAATPSWDDFRDPPVSVWRKDAEEFTDTSGEFHSLDGTPTDKFGKDDLAEVLYHGQTDAEDWDGNEAAVIRLKDDRLVAWETWWGPTGSGFWEDAYGGVADLWFAKPENLRELVLQALTDHGRQLCGIPKEGLPDA